MHLKYFANIRFKPPPPPVKYLTDRSKAVLLLWIFYVFLSCVRYVFVRVCLYVLCGHLLADLLALVCRV